MNYNNNNTIKNKTFSLQKENEPNNKEIKRKIESDQPSSQIKKSRFVNVSSSNPPFFNFPLKNLSELTKLLNIEEIINSLSHPKIKIKTSFITLNNEQLFGKKCALFYKKTTKNKVNLYCSFNENLGKGGFGDVVLGYKLNVDEKKIKEKAIKYSRNTNLLEESHSLDALYNKEKKLKFIQKRFKTLDFKNCFMLITKRYEGSLCNLMKKKTLTLFQKFQCFKQMTFGVDTIIKRNFIALDIKIENTLYKEKKDKIKVVLSDINPDNKDMILKKIENEKIRVNNPASYTTAKYLTINDLSKLSNCVEKYHIYISNKEKTEEPIEKYFETAKKMMVYQLGISFFLLVTKSFPIKNKHLCQLGGANLQASDLDNEKIKNNIEKKFKEIKKNVLSLELATLEKIETLLINMLKVKAKDRVDIEFVKKEMIILEKSFEGHNI